MVVDTTFVSYSLPLFHKRRIRPEESVRSSVSARFDAVAAQ
jgi:hypothetical protein